MMKTFSIKVPNKSVVAVYVRFPDFLGEKVY